MTKKISIAYLPRTSHYYITREDFILGLNLDLSANKIECFQVNSFHIKMEIKVYSASFIVCNVKYDDDNEYMLPSFIDRAILENLTMYNIEAVQKKDNYDYLYKKKIFSYFNSEMTFNVLDHFTSITTSGLRLTSIFNKNINVTLLSKDNILSMSGVQSYHYSIKSYDLYEDTKIVTNLRVQDSIADMIVTPTFNTDARELSFIYNYGKWVITNYHNYPTYQDTSKINIVIEWLIKYEDMLI